MTIPLAGAGSEHAIACFLSVQPEIETALVFTKREESLIRASLATAVIHNLGLPLSADPNVAREPNTFVGDSPYLLVVTGSSSDDQILNSEPTSLLRARFMGRTVVFDTTDRLVVWRQGTAQHHPPATRRADRMRLVAWAEAVVDAKPGTIFGRLSLESLLHETPVIVPASSSAREHAQLGNGGLWFEDEEDLIWCAEALADRPDAEALGLQGRRYAEKRYSGTQAFIDRVNSLLGPLMA